MIAAQVRAASGPLALLDDAVFLFAPTNIVEPAAIGVLSVCRSKDGKQFLARVNRARKTGEAFICGTDGKIAEVSLVTASPILAVIP